MKKTFEDKAQANTESRDLNLAHDIFSAALMGADPSMLSMDMVRREPVSMDGVLLGGALEAPNMPATPKPARPQNNKI